MSPADIEDFDVEELRSAWVGVEFDSKEFEVRQDHALEWAAACGETDPRYIDPGHPDFQAHPAFTSQFRTSLRLPDGFPLLGRGFDGGKSVEWHAPLRPGDRLTGTATIADIYEKTGRSGGMLFVVSRMRFENQNGELVSVVDSRILQQKGKRKKE